MEDRTSEIVLPKGTIIEVEGVRAELLQDTPVGSCVIADMGGYDEFSRRFGSNDCLRSQSPNGDQACRRDQPQFSPTVTKIGP
jgi:hypothetical protein